MEKTTIQVNTSILKESNKIYNKVLKGKIKEMKQCLSNNAMSETINSLNKFIKTNNDNIQSWILARETRNDIKVLFKPYLEQTLEVTYELMESKKDELKNSDIVSSVITDEEFENDKLIIKQIIIKYFNYSMKDINKEVSLIDKNIINELNNAYQLINDKSYKEKTISVLGNNLTKAQLNTLLISTKTLRNKEIDNLYDSIVKLATKQNNYPSKKISIDFEMSFKHIKVFEDSVLIGISYSDALDLLSEIDEKRYNKLIKKDEVLYGDILSNIEKSGKKFTLSKEQMNVMDKYDLRLY